jgi:hypothetical protein
LKTLITDTIEPDSWRDAGGTVGSISELAGLLIITQTPKAHERIANLLGQVREDHLRTVRVQADWLTLKPEDAAMLLVEPKAGKAVSTKSNPRLVDPAVLQKLAALCPHWRVELNCFSGQTVSIASGRTRTAIVDQEPVVAQNAAALGPQVKQVRDGAVLEITPTLETTLDTVVVDVHSQVANWTDAGPAPVAPTQVQVNPKDGAHLGGDSAANIDRLNLVTQDLRTAARVPVGPPVLVGGMTLEPAMGQSGAQLYLILQVTTAEAPTITAK